MLDLDGSYLARGEIQDLLFLYFGEGGHQMLIYFVTLGLFPYHCEPNCYTLAQLTFPLH